MSDETNIENVPAESETSVQKPQSSEPATEDVKPAKRRVGRPRKKAAAPKDAPADAPAADQSGSAEGEPALSPKEAEASKPAKPSKRRGRPRKTDVEASDAPAAAASAPVAESAEVLQARALAQISQASVVRRERKRAARAEKVLTEGSSEPAPSADLRMDAASDAPAANATEDAASVIAGQVPAVDPALRPHRRGRKPKAYVEAEKAAAAALVAQQAVLMEQREQTADSDKGDAVQNTAPASDIVAAEVSEPEQEADSKSGRDARPGRASRAKKTSTADKDRADSIDVPFTEVPANEPDAREGKQSRRTHQTRRENDRAERSDKKGSKADERRERRERQKENRKQRNNRFAPTEPSLTREELTAMKVAELREKARELDFDPTGIKKAELVEAVYAAAARAEGFRDIEGILDVDNQGFGYIRAHGYMPSRDDAFVPAQLIRGAGLRPGDYICGTLRPMRANDKLPGLAKLRSVNGMDPDQVKKRPKFSDLTPIYPNEPLKMEHGKDSITGRAIDIVSPIGKGQRGLIVSPPKAGKTTILKKICQSIAINNPEVHLICLLVDERPEEVTDMQRSIRGDVVASTFDMPADNHTRVSELVIERAKRIVEMGGDVVVVLDSITRLARAYNIAAPASGRILSGGVDSAALYPPKRFLGAARNIENGGSLTILASALIDTGSKMDEVIFEEFKGTGNMELKLDRDLADRRIFPAIDPIASGTRNEDLLVDEQMRPFVWGIRRILAGMNNTERAAASFIKGLKGTNSNQDFLIRTAKKAADHPDAL